MCEDRHDETLLLSVVILAAGSSQRMGQVNKLLALVKGKPMILRVVENIPTALFAEIIVITGHESEKVEEALSGTNVRIIHNDDYESGMASSLKTGVGHVMERAGGVLVLLGDMPNVKSETMIKLVDTFTDESSICAPAFEGKRGNPVLWGRDYFAEMMALNGDAGARFMLKTYHSKLVLVDVDDVGVLQDVDTVESLKQL